MYIRRRKVLRELVFMLRHIEQCPDDIEAVRSVNMRLLKLLLDAEEAISRHAEVQKNLRCQIKTGRLEKAEVRKLRGKLKRLDYYINVQFDHIFIWKCVGDALAFIYLDSLSLKHMFYDTDDYRVKQDAGSLSGKKGLNAELEVLNGALNHGVPAILCDLTNTLRFGDVCLLGGSDPVPIEVKTGTKINQRGKRQLAKLERMHKFFATDTADDFRGHSGTTIRIATTSALNYHLDAINEAIGKAKEHGHSVVMPEKGVTYLVIRSDSNPDKLMSELNLDLPEFYGLNHFKNERSWAAYVPFLLSIRETDHVLDFVQGKIYIAVVIDGRELVARFKDKDWEVRYCPNEEYSVQCLHRETGAYVGVSSQFIARAAFEFLSLESIVSSQKPTLEKMLELAKIGNHETEPEVIRNRLLEKFSADDPWFERILHSQMPRVE